MYDNTPVFYLDDILWNMICGFSCNFAIVQNQRDSVAAIERITIIINQNEDLPTP